MTGTQEEGRPLRDQSATRRLAMVLSGVLLMVLAIAPRALAAESVSTLGSSTEDDVMWFQGDVGESSGENVHILIKAPRKGRGHETFSRCDFDYSGAAAYSCGLDVKAGSATSKKKGAWKVVLKVDHAKLCTMRFKI